MAMRCLGYAFHGDLSFKKTIVSANHALAGCGRRISGCLSCASHIFCAGSAQDHRELSEGIKHPSHVERLDEDLGGPIWPTPPSDVRTAPDVTPSLTPAAQNKADAGGQNSL